MTGDRVTPERRTPTGGGASAQHLLPATRVMALGTIASRATGFLRTAVIAAALGGKLVADAYNVANTTPNIVYELLLGGVLTSVVVPLLVTARRRDPDGGEAYAQRLLTVVVVVLGGLSLVAVPAAPLVVDLYGSWASPDQQALAVTFARFFLPQIVFYGIGALIGGILNSRDRFAAPMWAPVLNNLVVIVTALLFLAVVVPDPTPADLTPAQVWLLGLGTTGGIVAQTVALVPSLRAIGFRLRLRFDWRGVGLARAGRLAGWVFVYVAANQIAYLVIVRLATAAAAPSGEGTASGFSPYQYAFLLFSLPHAIIAVSVITALLPELSGHAADGRLDLVRASLSQGLRLASVLLVPAGALCVALGPQIGVLVLGYGNMSVADARFVGVVLAAFAVGLVPFSAFQLLLRAFYALHDTRTPALLNIVVNAVNVVLAIGLSLALRPHQRVVGLALAHALSYVVGLALMAGALRGRLGGLDGMRIARTIARLTLAAAIGAVTAYLLGTLTWDRLGVDPLTSLAALAVGAAAGGGLFVLGARFLQVTELSPVAEALLGRSRFGRSLRGGR
ncbi:MAG TPA: murein biosynthesis integral membrane protein MurJ [Mycobacteriales bacterium]|nr:murein biosynthesis integral membrane protein MurJ [Mycobacteriales bacterium]